MVTYDEAEARKTDRAYLTPDINRQRMRTLIVASTKATGSLAVRQDAAYSHSLDCYPHRSVRTMLLAFTAQSGASVFPAQ